METQRDPINPTWGPIYGVPLMGSQMQGALSYGMTHIWGLKYGGVPFYGVSNMGGVPFYVVSAMG